MEPIEINRAMVCLVHNVTHGAAPSLIETMLSWRASDPVAVRITFLAKEEDVKDVEWICGVDFLQDALDNGQAGHPNVSPCLAEVSGEDFILTLRGYHENGQIIVSHATFDLEGVSLFMRQVRQLVGEVDYSSDVESLIASLPE